MKSVDDLILALRNNGIKLRIEAGNLAIDAPKGTLNAQIVEELRTHKTSIIALLHGNDMAQAVKIPRRMIDVQPLLSFAQQRLWFIDRLEGANSAYHISGAVRLIGGLDRVALRLTLDTLIERHESLRTRFAEVEGSAVQIISAASRFALEEVDIRGLGASEREEEVARQGREAVSAPFDLSVGPLIRGRLLRVAEQEHVLLLTMHHIVSDGWSLGILVREIGVLYSAYREGRPNPLAALPIQYADYAQWQRQWLVGDRLQVQLTYWQEQLSGAPALLELPTDRPRPLVQSYAGGSVEFALGTTLCGQLKAFSRQHDATLFMTLYAGFAVMLSKLSDQSDIVMGTAVANRQRTEVEGLIGFFVNTLALRVRLSDELTVSELLTQVREMTLAGYSHQETPFEQVVEVVRPPRSLSHSPIFQVLFALQNTPQSAVSLPGLTLAPQALPQTTAQFDLSLSLQEVGDDLVGGFSYASDLFDRQTIERWSNHFKSVLSCLVQDVEQSVSAITLLSATERHQLIRGFNDTQVEYPHDKLIHELFEEQVEKSPDAIAVVYEEEQLTYEELNGKANQLAQYLRAQGVKPDSLVGICVERSVEMVVGILGILKAGGAYVPLDPSYPQERLEYMLKDSAPKIVLTQARLKESLPATSAETISLDSEWPAIESYAATNLAVDALTPKHLAYVIYTSGSTGQPKGVMVEHRGLCNLAMAQIKSFEVKPDSRVLQFASLSFDACISEIAMTLCSGASLILASRLDLMPGEPLQALLSRRQISHATLPPVAASSLRFPKELESTFNTLIVAGEACSSGLAQQWAQRLRFINAYGPTEATVCASLYVCDSQNRGAPPIGRPISNTQMYLLDSHGEPVPIGVAGEIYIGGVGVARGYLNRAELTAERFVRDPFSQDANARMYKTGDLGRWRADGNIEYLGRNDHQVKIRGFRIELGEIESQITRHPQVKEAVVIVREDSPGEKRLVAYLTSGNEAPSIEALRAHLKGALPEYMIPSAFVALAQLPLTPNGKIDRKVLPAPERESYAVQVYEAPQGEIEQALAGIWQELLQVEQVGRHDNFFELGGHSLLILKLISRVQAHGFKASLRVVFEYPTIKALGAYLKNGDDIQSISDNLITLKKGGSSRPLFLLPAIDGSVLPYVPLVRLLNDDVPVHALQITEINNSLSIQQFATAYLKIIQRIQSHGPYKLAGWSMGALVAYEMAYQLLNIGESVEFVGLIDPVIRIARPQDAHLADELDDVSIVLSWLEFDPAIDQATLSELRSLGNVHLILDRYKQIGNLPATLTLMDLQVKIQTHRALAEICASYSPIRLPITSHFFLAKNKLPTHLSRDPALFAGDNALEITVGGTHQTIMKSPFLERLADAINQSLGEIVEMQFSTEGG